MCLKVTRIKSFEELKTIRLADLFSLNSRKPDNLIKPFQLDKAREWSGDVKVLCKLSVPGRHTNLATSLAF